jgi:hypothetical protein
MGFIYHLIMALEKKNINVFVGFNGCICEPVERLSNRIESIIVLVIFTSRYTESKWCLMKLVDINKCAEKDHLVAIPIFYKLDPSTVRGLSGQFGDAFRDLRESTGLMEKWKEALKSISDRPGIRVDKSSPKAKRIEIVVKKVLSRIPSEGSHNASVDPLENSDTRLTSSGEENRTFGIKERLKEFKDKLDLNKMRSQLGMVIGCLLVLFFVLKQSAYTSTRLIGEGGAIGAISAIDRIADNVPKIREYVPEEGTEKPRDTYTEFHTGKYGTKPERSSSDVKTNADLLDRTFTDTRMDGKVKPPKFQVFINFRGDQLRNNFVGYLVDALRRSEINVFIDNQEQRGEDLNTLFKRIEDSGIAIVVFSSRYTESKWCLEELVKIKERVHQGLLKVLPIFYKVTPTNVKRPKGEFGDHFRDKEYMYESDEPMIKRWKEAIVFISHRFALTLDEKSVAAHWRLILLKLSSRRS